MYASIDLAMDKIEKQLTRYKDRLKNHHSRRFAHHQAGALNELRVRHDIISLPTPEEATTNTVIDLTHRVIKTNEFLARPMSIDEAVMQMDLMNNDFLVFTNSGSQEMNVVYRRKDGHYGLIEASAAKVA
jgi:putative sigma-54 modulation protein